MLTLLLVLLPVTDPTPPVSLADLGRFPPATVIDQRLAWHAEHERWLWERETEQTDAGWRTWWGDVRWAARLAREAHEELRRAQDDGLSDDERLRHLRALCERLGPEAYYQGRLPQVWNWRCFRELPAAP